MRKVCSIFMVLMLWLSFTACSGNTNHEELSSSAQPSGSPSSAPEEESALPKDSSSPEETGAKSLVVYFSRSGNTEKVAEAIQSQTGSDIFEIVPAVPYSEDYDTVLTVAQAEQKADARPAISGSIEDIGQYDVVYVGFPIWWGDMPMILYTFFDDYDLSGKTVALFCTSGGSGLSNTVNEVKALEPDATVTEGLHIGSSSASSPDDAVSSWLDAIGLAG